jgi:protein-S-isoprenylcysteine O-methyltransferase Ste14
VSRIAVLFLVIVAPLLAGVLTWLGLMTLPTNVLGWILLIFGTGYIIGLLYVVFIQKRNFWASTLNSQVSHEERGDRSFWFLVLGMAPVFYLSPLEYLYFPFRITRMDILEFVGFIAFLAGIILFVWARHTLGNAYSGHLLVSDEQILITSGPYHVIRHPAYAGFFLITLGITLGYSSWLSLVCILVLLVPGMVYRIRLEEMLLLEQHGDRYRQYSSLTSRILPGIW